MLKPPRRARRVWPLVLGLALVGLVTLAVLNREDERVGLQEEVRIDQFGFRVLAVRTESSVGEDEQAIQADGRFLVVRLQVVNHLQTAAPFQFKPEFVTLLDATGTRHPYSKEATAALHYFDPDPDPCASLLRGGQACETELVFDVPADTEQPVLHISISNGGFWKLVDLLFYGEKSIQLG